jgi:hypothetical protein
MYMLTIGLIWIVCGLKDRNMGIGQKQQGIQMPMSFDLKSS